MRRAIRWKSALALGLAGCVLLALAASFHQRLWAAWCARQLVQAPETERPQWAERLAALDETGLKTAVALLQTGGPGAVQPAHAALEQWSRTWQDETHRRHLLQSLLGAYPQLASESQGVALELVAAMARGPGWPDDASPQVAALMTSAGRSADREMRLRALVLADALRAHGPELKAECQQRAREALIDPLPEVRRAAIALAAGPEIDLLAEIVPLLADPSVEVRQAAVAALGAPEAVATVSPDDLVRSLHDSDPDVRRLCEAALKARSLGDHDILLARLITAPEATVRLQVVERLRHFGDVEPGLWLRRLSRDASPAVRAAALRAATEFPQVDLSDRVVQMAQSDPSETIRQLAGHYLRMSQRAPRTEWSR